MKGCSEYIREKCSGWLETAGFTCRGRGHREPRGPRGWRLEGLQQQRPWQLLALGPGGPGLSSSLLLPCHVALLKA